MKKKFCVFSHMNGGIKIYENQFDCISDAENHVKYLKSKLESLEKFKNVDEILNFSIEPFFTF